MTPGAVIGVVTAAVIAVAAAVLVWWLRSRIVVVRVDGTSMEPTLQGNERLVVRRRRPDRLRTGQIVVLEPPVEVETDDWTWPRTGDALGRTWIVKRLAALPGETLPAELIRYQAMPSGPVPAGFGIVVGDNPRMSIDSRMFGPVPLDRVLGVAVRRFGESEPLTAGG
jgi:signal peptidase I